MKIALVSGALANKYRNGGAAWTRLHYVLGLQQLGFQTYFLEQIKAANCMDQDGRPARFQDCVNRAYFETISNEFGFAGRASLICGRETSGLAYDDLCALAADADLLINISGHLTLEPLKSLPRRKIFIDLDPGFTQIWCARGIGETNLDGHDCYFTVGENIGTPRCLIPEEGISWRATRPFFVKRYWPVVTPANFNGFATIATWRGPYGPVPFANQTFGLKVHEFRKFFDLPARTGRSFEIALDIHPADRGDLELLKRNGWNIVNPFELAANPSDFRRYIQHAGAEFSAAQGMYVQTRSGWFSDRTVRFLASGRPALVQDTGFTDHYATGEGLLAFKTIEEAVAGVVRITADYAAHCQAARHLALRHFDSDRVLGELLEQVGIAP